MNKKQVIFTALITLTISASLLGCSGPDKSATTSAKTSAIQKEQAEAPQKESSKKAETMSRTDKADKSEKTDKSDKEDKSVNYKTYTNARFGFSLSYPDVYSESTESDNGDGVTMEAKDKLHTLKVWSSVNTLGLTGFDLLEAAKAMVSHISDEYCDDHTYKVEYTGGDEVPIIFNEFACVNDDNIYGFTISYPENEKSKYKQIIEKMKREIEDISK